MKNTLKAIAAGLLVSFSAFAAHEGASVAPKLLNLGVDNVGSHGSLLQREVRGSIEILTVGIPVRVGFPDACTTFVGQETIPGRMIMGIVAPRPDGVPFTGFGSPTLVAKGSQNPLFHACITVMPRPIDTQFTLPFEVNTELPVVNPTLRKIVKIQGSSYEVVLNTATQEVRISRVLTAQPALQD